MCQLTILAQSSVFYSVPVSQSGIKFANNIVEDTSINIIKYDYLYNGAGVGIGDFDNDGLPDVFLAGNMVNDQLYMNQGGMKFKNITQSSGIIYNGWSTGVLVFDVNSDGYEDIYVLRSGPDNDQEKLRNVLYVNKGNGTFEEESKLFGLDLDGHHVQAAPLDFDLDGDLDLYVMGHPAEFQHKVSFQEVIKNIQNGNVDSDILLENRDGKYVDVTKNSGIFEYGYGLGLAITDINSDGYPDIIVCNDFDEPDHIFVNQKDNTFKDKNLKYFKHTSNYSMGNDVGDFNNDGLLDYISVDMAFENHERSKTNMASMNPEKFFARVQLGWGYQYMHNMLQLNTGMGSFQEISQISGVAKTDWSWAPLFMDIDMDGYLDIFISNGYKRDTKNNDIGFRLEEAKNKKGGLSVLEFLDLIPSVKIENFFFKNTQDLKFEDKRLEWGLDERLNSNGAAYADLDLDGDLDLVLNNMDTLTSIYENRINNKSNYFIVDLNSVSQDDVLGMKFKMETTEGVQFKEAYFVRGYCSTVEKKIYFYLPDGEVFKSLELIFPSGKRLVKEDLVQNQVLKLDSGYVDFVERLEDKKERPFFFQEVSEQFKLGFLHVENEFNEFDFESLIPHKMSTDGPFISVADIDNNGLDDFIITSSANRIPMVYLQEFIGKFTGKLSRSFYNHQLTEDAGIFIFDVNNDHKKDLLISSGGYQYEEGDSSLMNRLYVGNGLGLFGLVKNAIPKELTNSGKVVGHDIDKDGDIDFLVCGKANPLKYPYPGKTKIYINNKGFFSDQTILIAPEIEDVGMVSDAVFSDFDKDGDDDILLVGEWMDVEVFENVDGKFSKRKQSIDIRGWWTTIKNVDIDNDGDEDYVLGNAGMNNKFNPTYEKPLEIYANDFDSNGTLDIVLAYNKEGYQVPVRGRECSSSQMPFILDKFPTFDAFANSELSDIYGRKKLEEAIHLKATEFRSGILYNEGGKGFEFSPFPIECQFSFLNDFEIFDIDSDGKLDIIGVGNRYNTEVETSRYDSNCGVVLIQKSKREFTYLTSKETGFYVPYNAKSIELIHLGKEKQIGLLIGNNNQKVQLFKLND